MPKPSDIKNVKLRELMTASHAAIRSGDFTASIKQSSEAVRQLILLRPDVFTTALAERRNVLPPMVGVRLIVQNVPEPQIIFDREKFVMTEALAWHQYALEMVLAGEP